MSVQFYLFGNGFNDGDIFSDEGPGFFSGLGSFFVGAPPLFTFFFSAILLMIISVVLYSIIKGVTTYTRNNAAERLSERARVLTKRTEVSGGSGNSRAYTNYYLTFEFEDGRRTEFEVRAEEYGLLVEGDEGTLTHQGTRYLGFERMGSSLRS
ncbi:DUF2500 domain-containing protein [Paenibacillus polygoni]|uniref:DUF2500 domain-containing protein n=1 Tax=Paenibacillus polygoni TaxID=3050112 RepID=A0ABY8X766_9BACL|nr:DUF2500 domain-containing protein [Paenibacillus polygoni]WIV20974.1 DUF2500 domain-containing protein [Paenibacillus polygoni]